MKVMMIVLLNKESPAAKKLKVDVRSRRYSEQLKQAKDTGDGTSGSHSSQQRSKQKERILEEEVIDNKERLV